MSDKISESVARNPVDRPLATPKPPPATPTDEATARILKLEERINAKDETIRELEGKLLIQHNSLASKGAEIHQLSDRIHIHESGEKQARGEAKILRQSVAELKAHLAADPNLQELKRLREEVSLGQSKYQSLKKDLDAQIRGWASAEVERKAAEARFKALESTSALMQKARDAAQVRESQAFQRVAELDRNLAKALSSKADAEKTSIELQGFKNEILDIHKRGHLEPVAGCSLCAAFGRRPSPVDAAPAEVKPS